MTATNVTNPIFDFNLSLLSKWRQELMGGGTLLILICHAYGNNVVMPTMIERIVDNAQIGVDLFLLLSGIGIAFSLNKTVVGSGCQSLGAWYIHRFQRIYVPFLILMCLYYVYKIPFEGESWLTAFLDIANIGWWINGKGTWYISLILLLYVFAPILYRWLIGSKYSWLYLIVLCCAIWIIFQDDFNSPLHYVNNAIKRAPAFFIGMALTPYVKTGVKTNLLWLSIISCVAFVIAYNLLPLGFCKWIVILPFTMALAIIIEHIQIVRKPLSFLGMISLESYLANVTLGDILNHKSWILWGHDLSYGHYLEYTLVVVLGLLLAWMVNKASKQILFNISK